MRSSDVMDTIGEMSRHTDVNGCSSFPRDALVTRDAAPNAVYGISETGLVSCPGHFVSAVSRVTRFLTVAAQFRYGAAMGRHAGRGEKVR
jgi:hypothetical protein